MSTGASSHHGRPSKTLRRVGGADELAARVILDIHRLAEQAMVLDTELNEQESLLKATAEALRVYGAQTGQNFTLFWLDTAVFVGGRLLRAGRMIYGAALELREILAVLGVSQLQIGFDVPRNELFRLQEVFRVLQRNGKPSSEQLSFSRIRLQRVPDLAARVSQSPDDDEQRVRETYAKAVAGVRRFIGQLGQGHREPSRRLNRIDQQLTDLAIAAPASLLAVTAANHAANDDASRTVCATILSIFMVLQLGGEPRIASEVAMASLLYDAGRPRVSGVNPRGSDRGVSELAPLNESQSRELTGATTAILTATNGLHVGTMMQSAVICEALHLNMPRILGSSYGGLRGPSVHARIVALAHRYANLSSEAQDGRAHSGSYALTRLQAELADEPSKNLFRLLASVLGIFPDGSLVELSTGEIAQVIASPVDPAKVSRPLVQTLLDAHHRQLARAQRIDLAVTPSGRGPALTVRRLIALADPEQIRQALERRARQHGRRQGDDSIEAEVAGFEARRLHSAALEPTIDEPAAPPPARAEASQPDPAVSDPFAAFDESDGTLEATLGADVDEDAQTSVFASLSDKAEAGRSDPFAAFDESDGTLEAPFLVEAEDDGAAFEAPTAVLSKNRLPVPSSSSSPAEEDAESGAPTAVLSPQRHRPPIPPPAPAVATVESALRATADDTESDAATAVFSRSAHQGAASAASEHAAGISQASCEDDDDVDDDAETAIFSRAAVAESMGVAELVESEPSPGSDEDRGDRVSIPDELALAVTVPTKRPHAAPVPASPEGEGELELEQTGETEEASIVPSGQEQHIFEEISAQQLSPAAQGSLQQTPLEHLLVYAVDQELTGSILLPSEESGCHVIYFEAGTPCKVCTARGVAPLDQTLVALRLLDQATLQQSLEVITRTGGLHGEYLLSQGLLTRNDLLMALRRQLERKTEYILALPRHTRFVYYDQVNLLARYGGPELTPCDPLGLVMVGVRLHASEPETEQILQRMGQAALVIHPDANTARLGLRDDERRVIQALKTRPLAYSELLASAVATPTVVKQTVYALLITRCIQFGTKIKAPVGLKPHRQPDPPPPSAHSSLPAAPSHPPTPGSQLPAAPSHPPTRGSQLPAAPSHPPTQGSQLPAAPSHPPTRGSQLPAAPSHPPTQGSQLPAAPSHPPTRGSQLPAAPSHPPTRDSQLPAAPSRPPAPSSAPPVPPRPPARSSSAPPVPSRPPSHSSSAPPAPSRPPERTPSGPPTPPPLPQRTSQVAATASGAAMIPLSRQEVRQRAEQIAQVNHFELLEITEEATTEEIRQAYYRAAKRWHPDRLPAELSDMKGTAAKIFARIGEAFKVLEDELQRQRYRQSLRTEGGADEQQLVAKVVDAAMDFQKGEVLFKKGELAQAEQLVESAANADPEQIEYRTLLAWIRAQRLGPPPGLQPGQSTEHFRAHIEQLDEVLAQEPQYERALFYRACLLKQAGHLNRAMNDFKAVVAINPRNIDASREVRLYQKREKQNQTKKKKGWGLFGR